MEVKMKKKIFSLLMAAIMATSLIACGGQNNTVTNNPTEETKEDTSQNQTSSDATQEETKEETQEEAPAEETQATKPTEPTGQLIIGSVTDLSKEF